MSSSLSSLSPSSLSSSSSSLSNLRRLSDSSIENETECFDELLRLLLLSLPLSGSLVIRGSSSTTNISSNNKNYYKQLLEKKTRKALTSGALQPVLDGGGQGHSVFASAFLNILKNNNQVISGDVFSSSIKQVVTNNAEQTPLYKVVPKTGDEGGDFIFVPQN